MKKVILFYFFLFTGSLVFSQNDEPEQLIKELKTSKADTNKLNLYAKIAASLKGSDPEKAIQYLNESLELSRSLKEEKRTRLILSNLGSLNSLLANYDEALKNNLEAIEIAKKLNLKNELGSSYRNIGIVYFNLGKYELATDHYYKSLRIKEETGTKSEIGMCYINIGNVNTAQQDFSTAAKNYNKGLEYFKSAGDSAKMGIAYDAIGSVFINTDKRDEALKYLFMALEMKERTKSINSKSFTYQKIAFVYNLQEKYDLAIQNYLKALEIIEKKGDKNELSQVMMLLANNYVNSGKYQAAIPYLNKGLENAKETRSKAVIKEGYYIAAELYSKLKDYEKAYEYSDLYIGITDTLFNEDRNAQLAEMQTKYETEKKEKEISLLTQKSQIQELEISRNWYLIIGLGSSLFLVAIIALLLVGRNKLKASQVKMEIEQKLFRSQMNPHFIFNSLIAIQNYVYRHEASDTAKYISNFAKLMRMILENSRSERVTIEKELATLKYYLELQQLRFPDKFDYNVEVDPNIDIESISIPPMLCQPFIENAIEHGIMNKKDGKGKIEIIFEQKDRMIQMTIRDNGVGRDFSGNQKNTIENKHQSLATTITGERLALLNRSSRQKFTLNTIDLKNEEGTATGTEVIIKMPEA